MMNEKRVSFTISVQTSLAKSVIIRAIKSLVQGGERLVETNDHGTYHIDELIGDVGHVWYRSPSLVVG